MSRFGFRLASPFDSVCMRESYQVDCRRWSLLSWGRGFQPVSNLRVSSHRLGEPPDLFWWDRVQMSLRIARPIDSHAMPSVARGSKPLCVEMSLHADTNNMKSVARWCEPRGTGRLETGFQPASLRRARD